MSINPRKLLEICLRRFEEHGYNVISKFEIFSNSIKAHQILFYEETGTS